MDFHLFPFDYQLCPIHLESFGYSTADMTFNWVGNSSIQYNEGSEMGGSLRMGDMVLMEKYIKPGTFTRLSHGLGHKSSNLVTVIYGP